MSPKSYKNFLVHSLPSSIYFDTNFVVNALIKREKNYLRNLSCRYFIDRLLQSNVNIYFSSIIFPEFWHAALRIAIADDQGYKTDREVSDYLRGNKGVAISKHIEYIKNMQVQFDKLMTLINEKAQRVFVIETERIIMEHALKFMNDYNILSYDAIHFASAAIGIPAKSEEGLEKPSIFDIATFDSDFESIDCEYLKIWNKGDDYGSILKYEKSLKRDRLQPDGIILTKDKKNKTLSR